LITNSSNTGIVRFNYDEGTSKHVTHNYKTIQLLLIRFQSGTTVQNVNGHTAHNRYMPFVLMSLFIPRDKFAIILGTASYANKQTL